jgi:hypothetical protein
MPVPPNWFGVAAFALLGAFVNPALWLIGIGSEGLYLWTLSRHPRFRATVDAEQGQTDWHSRYAQLSSYLSQDARDQQTTIEAQANEICELLSRTGANRIADERRAAKMAWVHLKLLAARASGAAGHSSAGRESRNLEEQERRLIDRLSKEAVGDRAASAASNSSSK